MKYVTGKKAIEAAKYFGFPLNKYADPTEGARENISLDEAITIAQGDPNLVYVPVAPWLVLRRRNVPSNYSHVAYDAPQFEGLYLEVFCQELADKVYVMGFSGRSIKPDFHYRFRSLAAAYEHIRQWQEKRLVWKQRREDDRARAKAFQHTLKPGDILVCSWGYDQTNIDFFQVTKLLGTKMVEIRKIGQNKTYEGYETGLTEPVKDNFIGEPRRVKVSDGNYVRIYSFASAGPYRGGKYHWSSTH